MKNCHYIDPAFSSSRKNLRLIASKMDSYYQLGVED